MSRLWTHPPALLEQRRRAWEAFVADPAADVSGLVREHVGRIACVVDAGCGAGQELLPYLRDAVCVGADVSAPTLALAASLLRGRDADARLTLLRARVEALPLRAQRADVVICRLTLQHTDVRRALSEIARVLRPGGGGGVTFHHHRYYLRKLAGAARAADLRPVVYALRVLLTGLCFHLSGTQRRILGMGVTSLTRTRVRRMAAAVGLDLVGELPAGSALAPQLLFRRRE